MILLAIKGAQAPSLLKDYTFRKKGDRFLRIHLGARTVLLPIRGITRLKE